MIHGNLSSAGCTDTGALDLTSFLRHSAIWRRLFGGVDHGGVEYWPQEICRRGQSMFWPQNVIFFHSKLLFDNSASFTSSWMKDLCQKMKGKTIFSRRLQAVRIRGCWGFENCCSIVNSLMAWPDLSWPPYFTTDLRHCAFLWVPCTTLWTSMHSVAFWTAYVIQNLETSHIRMWGP